MISFFLILLNKNINLQNAASLVMSYVLISFIVFSDNIIYGPMALMLMKENATVTVCHKETENLVNHLKMADIVIVACGQPKLIKKEWLKIGVVVIDVGINMVCTTEGNRLVGDVDYDNVKDIAGAITPVPGGVGPMTVAMLLKNTLRAYKLQNKRA